MTFYYISGRAGFFGLRDRGVFLAVLDPFFDEEDVFLLEGGLVAHLEVNAVFFVAVEHPGVAGVQDATVEAGLPVLEELLAAAEAEVRDYGGFRVGPLDLVVELGWALEEDVGAASVLDINDLVDLVKVVLEENLLAVVNKLLEIYAIEVAMVECENPK